MKPNNEAVLRVALTAVDDQLVAILNKADGYWYNKLRAARNDLVRIWLPLAATANTEGKIVAKDGGEPVAWMTEPTSAAHPSMRREVMFDKPQAVKADFTVTPLYTHPHPEAIAEQPAGAVQMRDDKFQFFPQNGYIEMLAAAPSPAGKSLNAVGDASFMPGTEGFTMACFKAADVPAGTKLYAPTVPGEST